MDMNNKLLHDKNTNVVFLSPCLNTKKYGNPKFYKELMTILKEMGIETRELKCTRDYWARDYMPIQLDKNDFLKYHYYPDYLINKDDIDSITDVSLMQPRCCVVWVSVAVQPISSLMVVIWCHAVHIL